MSPASIFASRSSVSEINWQVVPATGHQSVLRYKVGPMIIPHYFTKNCLYCNTLPLLEPDYTAYREQLQQVPERI